MCHRQSNAEPGLRCSGEAHGPFFYRQKDKRITSIPKILEEKTKGGKMNYFPSCHRGTVREAARMCGLQGPVCGAEGAGALGDQRVAPRANGPLASAGPGPLAAGEIRVRPGRCGCGNGAPGSPPNHSVTLLVLGRIQYRNSRPSHPSARGRGDSPSHLPPACTPPAPPAAAAS